MAFRAQQWLQTEFEVLCRLVHARLARPELDSAWEQVVAAIRLLLRHGVVHGDLSPYNLLWHEGRVVVIDFPQAVDPIAHPEGLALLERDVTNVCDWFRRRGIDAGAAEVFADVLDEIL